MEKSEANDDIAVPGDLTEEQIDSILDSGNVDDIDNLMKVEESEPEPEPEPVPEPEPEKESENISDKEPEKKADEKNGAPSGTEDEKPVLAANGKDFIPYNVLKSTRERVQEVELARLETEKEKNQEAEKYQNLLAKTKALGLDLESTEIKDLTQEQFAELEQLDPTVSASFKVLHRNNMVLNQRNEALEKQIAETNNLIAQQQDNVAVTAAISRNAELASWQADDEARFETASYYDDQLRDDPAFKEKSLDERFAEAVRRTHAAYGITEKPTEKAAPESETKPAAVSEEAKKLATQKVADAKAVQAPTSLTDVGKQPVTEQTLAQRLSGLEGDALQAEVEKLSTDQLNQFYADLEFV